VANQARKGRTLGEAEFHATVKHPVDDKACRVTGGSDDSKTYARATDWRTDMKKVPSMIQDGSHPRESTHLSNANTTVSPVRPPRERSFFCDLAGRAGTTSNIRCGATQLAGSQFHSVIGSM